MKERTRSTAGSVAVITALLAFSTPIAAQRSLTLEEALQHARVHNRNLEAARARLDQSTADISQAWGVLLPQLSAQGKYTHNYKDVEVDPSRFMPSGSNLPPPSGDPVFIQKREQFSAGLTALVPLVVPSAYPALSAVRRAHGARAAELSLTESTVLFSVAQSYFVAAGADEILVARNNAVTVAKQTLSNAQVLYQGGKATSVEVMRAQVAVVRAEQAEREARDIQARAYRALCTLIGAREPVRAVPSEALPEKASAREKLIEQALRKRPEFSLYQESMEAADANGDAAAWRWAPTLSAFGNLQAFNFKGFSGDNYSWALGLQLDWIIYDGGVRDAQSERASAQKREYEARLYALSDTVSDEIANAREALATKRSALQSAMRAAELSRETLRLVRIQYEGGKATQLDLLQAQDSLVAAEVAVAQARFALALADIELKKDAGLFPSNGRNR
ncbi:MAG: TolC family protein [Deltaproteobacteria bacterium]|nr:TolC family protein [Deltaproteobacteria bacterium]